MLLIAVIEKFSVSKLLLVQCLLIRRRLDKLVIFVEDVFDIGLLFLYEILRRKLFYGETFVGVMTCVVLSGNFPGLFGFEKV